MYAKHPMVVAAARVLCKRSAELRNVDADDSWKVYGEDYLAEAQAVLDAAAASDLLEACQQAVRWMEGWASATPYIEVLDAAIARATGEAPCR